jgi:hypothetical protein
MWINISFNVNLVTLGSMNKMLMISLIPPKNLIGKGFPLGESYGIRCGASFKRHGWKFLQGTPWMKILFEIFPNVLWRTLDLKLQQKILAFNLFGHDC